MQKLIPVVFPSSERHSVRLEGLVHLPEAKGKRPAAVVCHPHPLGGGNMDNGLTVAIAQALASRGVMALRFNFRGVGGSAGRYDHGRAEQADVAGALDWILSQPGIDPQRASLVGYSFGAWVALSRAQIDSRPAGVAAIGLGAWHYDSGFRSSKAWPHLGGEPWELDPGLLMGYTKPKVFVVGEQDPFAPLSLLKRFVEPLPEPKALLVVPGTDHFFLGHERKVGELVASAVSSF